MNWSKSIELQFKISKSDCAQIGFFFFCFWMRLMATIHHWNQTKENNRSICNPQLNKKHFSMRCFFLFRFLFFYRSLWSSTNKNAKEKHYESDQNKLTENKGMTTKNTSQYVLWWWCGWWCPFSDPWWCGWLSGSTTRSPLNNGWT